MTSHRTNFSSSEPGIPKQRVFRVPEDVRATHGPDGATLLDVRRGKMFRLNFVGSRIFELVKQGAIEADIAEVLSREFGIERVVAEADLHGFLQTLERLRLLAPES
jgi:hypothetical protein